MTAEWHIQATSVSFGYVERFLYKLDDYIRAYNISDKDATAVKLGVCLSIAREEAAKAEIYPKTIRNWTASEAAVAEMVNGLTSEEKLRLAYESPPHHLCFTPIYVFSPGICWIGLTLNLCGSDVQTLQMCS